MVSNIRFIFTYISVYLASCRAGETILKVGVKSVIVFKELEILLEIWSLRLAKTHSKSSLYFKIRSGVNAFETQKLWNITVWKYSEQKVTLKILNILWKNNCIQLNKLFEILQYSLSCWHEFISSSFQIKLVCYVLMDIQNRQWIVTPAFHCCTQPGFETTSSWKRSLHDVYTMFGIYQQKFNCVNCGVLSLVLPLDIFLLSDRCFWNK